MSRHHVAIKNDPRYKAWRRLVIERDQVCQACGTDEQLSADHVRPLAEGGEPFDPDNGVCLCVPCNSRKGDRKTVRIAFVNKKWLSSLKPKEETETHSDPVF